MFNAYNHLDPLAKFIVDQDPDAKSSMDMEKEAAAKFMLEDFFPKMSQAVKDNEPNRVPPINSDIQGDAPKQQPIPGNIKAPQNPVRAPKAPKLPTYEPKPDQMKMGQKLPPLTPSYQLPTGPGGTFKTKKKKKNQPQQKVGFVMLHEALHGKQAQFTNAKPVQPGKPSKPIAGPTKVKGNLAGTHTPKPMSSSPSAKPPQGGAASPITPSSGPKAKKPEFGNVKQASIDMLVEFVESQNV